MKPARGGWLRFVALVSLTAGLTVGCGSQRYVRESTEVAVGHVDNLRGDFGRYVQQGADDARARIDRVALARQRTARAEQSLDTRVELGDGRAPFGSLYKDLVAEATKTIQTERTLAGMAAAERAALLEKQKAVDKEALKKLQELSKQLQELTKPAHLKEEVKFLIEYLEAVGKAVKDLDAKAGDAKKKAGEGEATPAQ